MIARLVLALVVGAVTGLVCLLLGTILASLGIPIIHTIGSFIHTWAWVLGALAGLWYFFRGGIVIS